LVIMGASLAISLGRRLERGEPGGQVLRQAARRAAVIFLLGLFMSLLSVSYYGVFRIPGVLQRIALCYLACAFIFVNTKPLAQVFTALALLAGYWALLCFAPAPGGSAGDLSLGHNLVSYLDQLVLGTHRWAPQDPEGVLSTLPAIATALLGVLAGQWLRARVRSEHKAEDLILGGLALAAVGLGWGHRFPVNKNLWTSSYALFSGGAAVCGLGVCYWLIEAKDLRAWGKPLAVIGLNPLVAYFFSEVAYGLQMFVRVPMRGGREGELHLWLDGRLFGWLSPPNASLAYSLCHVLFCLGVMWLLYRRKVFVKV
jgi:predicted acyltransferase